MWDIGIGCLARERTGARAPPRSLGQRLADIAMELRHLAGILR